MEVCQFPENSKQTLLEMSVVQKNTKHNKSLFVFLFSGTHWVSWEKTMQGISESELPSI
jgi:hypothetical protein